MTGHRDRIGLTALVPSILIIIVACSQSETRAAAELGEVRLDVSCGDAQSRFDHAVALLHHMTYDQARAEFAAIAADQPDCAMAHWGIAMTLFQPLWPTRPGAEDLRRGLEAVTKAQEIGAATPREEMFIATAAAFFDPARTEYWDRISAWAGATRALHDAYPGDTESSAFYALSILATAPPSGDMSHHAEAAGVLAGVLADSPTHPGAVHYMVHASDAAGREHESIDVVRRYDEIAPRNPHALHMPTHVYTRLGEWQNVVAGNIEAAQAALEHPAGGDQQWTWDEFPHAIEYLVYASLQIGDDAKAREAMTKLAQVSNLQPTFKTAFHLSSIPARYALERRDWAGAAALEPRAHQGLAWDRFPWPEAVTWFARGIGALRSGDEPAGREAEAKLIELKNASAQLGEDLFARQTEIMRLGVSAWIAHAEGKADEAVRLMQEAVRLEASTPKPPVTPAPILPAAEQLGDLLLELDRPADALDAYGASLEAAPRRFNSVAGAARAARALGDSALATRYYRQLIEIAVPGSSRRELAEAAGFVRTAAG
jgi:tetratricopeptide (TPR) repeat protein